MDSSLLLGMLDFIQENRKEVHSLLIVRGGHIVWEAYYDPYQPDTRHHLASVTKSILSMLVGAAIQDGAIHSVNQRITEYFPELRAAGADPAKTDITIKHLLTMTAGIRWQESARSYFRLHSPFVQMTLQKDWVQYVLDQPMAAKPGERYIYSSGVSHLVSAILQQATGKVAADYAQERLFGPLAIWDTHWEADPSGITKGGWGLYLTPRDMAKLGYLYLRNGAWQGEAVLPASWVAESTREHVSLLSSRDARYKIWEGIYRLVRRDPPFIGYGYGYHWGIPAFGGYAARGIGGQAIFVLPEHDLVAVFTGGLPPHDQLLPEKLMEGYILPAARPNALRAAGAPGLDTLAAAIEKRGRPERKAVPPAPQKATSISDRPYVFGANPFGIQSLSLSFPPGSEAVLTIGQNGEVQTLTVGLDNVYRSNRIGEQDPIALKGGWTGEDTFTIDMLIVPPGRRYELILTFQGEGLRYISRGIIEGRAWRMVGRRQA